MGIFEGFELGQLIAVGVIIALCVFYGGKNLLSDGNGKNNGKSNNSSSNNNNSNTENS